MTQIPELVVGRTRVETLKDGRLKLSAPIRSETEERAWITLPAGTPPPVVPKGDVWVGPMMMLAMATGRRLVVTEPVSPERVERLALVREIFTNQFPSTLTDVPVDLTPGAPPLPPRTFREKVGARIAGRPVVPAPRPDSRATVSCFTLGADSFHTALTARDSLDGLFYVRGGDIPVKLKGHNAGVEARIARVAEELGLGVFVAETNLRKLIVPTVNWGGQGHMSVFASVIHAFSGAVRRLMVPSTYTWGQPVAWGTNNYLDPLWSSDAVQIESHDRTVTRHEKLVALADEPLAQEFLRVCFRTFDGNNCGECWKCLRTMAVLRGVGKLEKFGTFPPLDLEKIRSYEGAPRSNAFNIAYTLHAFGDDPANAELVEALRAVMDRMGGPPTPDYGPTATQQRPAW